MPNYNNGYIYNAYGVEGGLFYNSEYLIIVDVREALRVSEDINKLLATYALKDRTSLYDGIVQTAVYGVSDKFASDDDVDFSVLFEFTDNLGITDDITALIVFASLHDEYKFLEDIKQFNEYLLQEQFKLPEDIDIDAFIKTTDKLGLTDLKAALSTLYSLYEKEGIVDGQPRSAVSDFIIGSINDYDRAYDWFLPFGMKVDWDTTSIQVMPEAQVTSIEMPGIDGSIIEDTVYKDRLFQIVAFSEQGLTAMEKEELKTKITQVLDATKNTTKKLTILPGDSSFDVKYEGIANIVEGPSYVKATIPLRTTPYGYRTFESELYGNGLINNQGDAPNGVKHTISGPISNPTFTLGETTYKWTGSVPDGSSLVIDHAMMTCYLQDGFGVKTNAMSKLTGAFQKIPAHSSVTLTANSATAKVIITTWKDKVLW